MIISGNTPAHVEQAAQALCAGELLGLPTETVYGLAADASQEMAVAKIFQAKGRPPNHPLIVHVHSADAVEKFAHDVPAFATALMTAFWPGPLTLVFRKDKSVPLEATGGQETVAIRAPAHPLTQELLRKFKGGIVGPSANRFGKVSPTSAADVRSEFEGMLDLMVLDGGDCQVGIESTIVDLSSSDHPTLLRPGIITPGEILEKTGIKIFLPGEIIPAEGGVDIPRVSGSLRAHYAPTTPLRLYAPGRVLDALSEFPDIKSRVAVAVWDSDSALGEDGHPSVHFEEVLVPSDSVGFAGKLYRTLRDLDQQGWDLILLPEPPPGEEWDGVRDRLQRACFGSGPSSSNHANS